MYVPVSFKPFLYWLLLFSLMAFGVFLSWDLGFLPLIIEQDNTRICMIILLLLLAMSCHCAYRSVVLSAQFQMFDAFYQESNSCKDKSISKRYPPGRSLAQEYLFSSAQTQKAELQSDKALMAELLVEETRGSHQVGWFVVAAMIKLGLLGTVIGFIIMLSSVSGLENLTISDVKDLMQKMTEGMGVAMSTTLIGLIGSMLLSAQYLLLDRMADRFVVLNISLGDRFQSAPVDASGTAL